MQQNRPIEKNDTLFTTVIDRDAEQTNYLGDSEEVQTWLALLVGEFVDDPSEMEELSEQFASVVLGRTQDWAPIPGWNRPGGVDAHIASEYGLSEEDPADRAKWLFLNTLEPVVEAMVKAGEEFDEDDWGWEVEAALEETTRVLLGLPAGDPEVEDED